MNRAKLACFPRLDAANASDHFLFGAAATFDALAGAPYITAFGAMHRTSLQAVAYIPR
jgi:hypothetical protein